MTDKLVIVRLRGIRNMEPKIAHTLMMLRLNKPNHCVIVDATPQMLGMVNVVRDYVAYGKIDEKTIIALVKKRGNKESKKTDKKTNEKANTVFRLHPPRKGLKDIKQSYPEGDLGERPDINEFIKRMM